MSDKFREGDILVYSGYGLCRLECIKSKSFIPGEAGQNYYMLVPPADSTSTYYVPVENEKAVAKLRYPLTEDGIKSLLQESCKTEIQLIENRQTRSDVFNGILRKGICAELICLVRCFHSRQEYLSAQGKSISSTDEMIFNSARKLLSEEFSYGLGIEKDNIRKYIADFLSQNNECP